MKSEAELDVILESLNEREPFRGAVLEWFDGAVGLYGTKLGKRLVVFSLCARDVAEALAIPDGSFGAERARRNTKTGLVKAARKLDEEIDKRYRSADIETQAAIRARAAEIAAEQSA